MDRDLCDALRALDDIVDDALALGLGPTHPDAQTPDEILSDLLNTLADWRADHQLALIRAERQA